MSNYTYELFQKVSSAAWFQTDTTKADAFIWRIRLDESNSCDHKLGNTRQDGDQVLCVILLYSYIHKTLKKRGSNEIFIRGKFQRLKVKKSNTKRNDLNQKILEGEKIRNSLLEI